MKLTLNGPQAITIFTVAKEELIPSSARAASFSTPQAYYCVECCKLKMFIKGQEYNFLAHDKHEEIVKEITESHTGIKQEDAKAYADKDVEEMWSRWNEIHARHEELSNRVEAIEHEMSTVRDTIYTPLHTAFHALMTDGK